MAGEWGHTLPPDEVDTDLSHAMAERPPQRRQRPLDWAHTNLFSTKLNGVITVVLGLIGSYLTFRVLRFVFVTARWEPVTENLTLFMTGTFPRDEQWRIVVQMYLLAAAAGLVWGAVVAAARDRFNEAGGTYRHESLLSRMRRYWPLGLFAAVLLIPTDTIQPTLFLLSAFALILGLQGLASRLPTSVRDVTIAVAALCGVAAFQVLTGTGGSAWLFAGLPLAFLAYREVGDWDLTKGWARIAPLVTAVLVLVLARTVYGMVDIDGVGWDKWKGLHLTLLASFTAIVLAFPMGLLLALARRSSLPAVRVLSTSYIELIRGVPLISLLLMGEFFIGFFVNTDTPLSQMTRAITAMTMFTSAYVAEIVRGGLQAVPNGQVEAGQALGLSTASIMRRLVLPQALRAVIPAMVGQFISLFKDSTLLAIIGIQEFLGVRDSVHSQAAFRSVGIAETLVFVAFGFWAVAYTMSRESQRLERRLGVGER